MKFPYKWTLRDANFAKDKGTVFSCFACAGGSTLGYKLAGFDVIGCNEIDKRANDIYVANNNPKYNYLCDIRDLVKIAKEGKLPGELYTLDILDGSPPCSTFSTAGLREQAWGVKKKFREGQKAQILDTLFFDFIELANELQPKIIIAENVSGLLVGNARDYVLRIVKGFNDAGYICNYFLLDSSKMGVPQRRQRIFFVAVQNKYRSIICKKDSFFDMDIDVQFNQSEKPITYGDFADEDGYNPTKQTLDLALKIIDSDKNFGDTNLRLNGKYSNYNSKYVRLNETPPTLTASAKIFAPHKNKFLSDMENMLISSFPIDFDFCNNSVQYYCGMSVPPVMMATVATDVCNQILTKIK